MNTSMINALSSLFGKQQTAPVNNESNVNFQNYLTEALDTKTDLTSAIDSLKVSEVTGAALPTSTEAVSSTQNSELAAMLSSLQGVTNTSAVSNTDYSALLSSIQSTDSSSVTSLLSSLQGATAADATQTNTTGLLASLQSMGATGGTTATQATTSSTDPLMADLKSDMFANLNAAKAKLEGNYFDFAARIGDTVTANQQARLSEMQQKISALNGYIATNIAPQAYEKAKLQS